jgi:uncharacterized protein (DUF849 family)
LQPRIPVSVPEIVAEGIEAAESGAAIVHVHVYDLATGRQKDDWEVYARVIEGIRSRADVIVYPTLPLTGIWVTADTGSADESRPSSEAGSVSEARAAAARFRHVAELGARGLIEWAVVDPGSVNISRFSEIRRDKPGSIYLNPESHVREGLRLAARHGFRPSYAIYEPGFTRLGAALAAAVPGLRTPIYRFMFSDEFAWGFPPKPYGLDAHLRLLDEAAPGAPWMVAGLGADISPIVAEAVARGGHVRTGLEDVRLGTDRSNRALVEDVGRRVRAAGSEPATAQQVRDTLTDIDSRLRPSRS